MDLLRTTDDLAQACQRLRRSKYITVDTEFIRDQTYWPELCLLQIAGPEPDAVFLVDPLAKGLSLEPFFEILKAKRVTKVLHAGRQDIEIFYHMAGLVPQPVFDTQVAAMVCGFGESVGYEALVRRLLNKTIDKSSRFTDWRRRPLSEQQLTYAVSDVTHLRDIYAELSQRLADNERESWVAEEMATLLDPATYTLAPEDGWRRIKTKGLNRKALGVLMEVAGWREREAQTRNIPRARIMKDDALVEIAHQTPTTREELSQLRALPGGFANSRAAKALLEAVARGLALTPSQIPMPPRPRHVPPEAHPTVELLKVLLKTKCAEHGVAQKLVASTADLEAIATEHDANVPALNGWRRDVFGADALALNAGELALGARRGTVTLFQVRGNQAGPTTRRSRSTAS